MDTDLTLNTRNILALTAIITLVLLSGIGGYYLAQTNTTPHKKTQ